MAAKKSKLCQICRTSFTGRKDAKTCSPKCRKRLQRNIQADLAIKAQRLESAVGKKFHELAAELLSAHAVLTPHVLADERGAIAVTEEPQVKAEPTTPVAQASPPAAPVAPVEPVAQTIEVATPPPAAEPVAEPVTEPVVEPAAESLETVPVRVVSEQPAQTPQPEQPDVVSVPVEDTISANTATAAEAIHLEDTLSTESLEPTAMATQNLEAADDLPPDEAKPKRHFAPFGFNKLAFAMTSMALLAVLLIGGVGVFLSARQHAESDKAKRDPGSFAVGSVPLAGVPAGQQLTLGEANQVTINGQLKVNDTLVVAPTDQPAAPTAGQIYFDKTNNTLYYYNGSQFIGLTSGVSSLGGAKGDISLGNGLTLNNNQLSLSNTIVQQINGAKGVTSLQGQTGDLALSAGAGVAINGLNISNSGVLSVTGTANQINVSAGTGNITLSLPQDIATTSSPTFAGLTVNGTLSVGAIQHSVGGSDLSISAGSDNISFTANGRTFVLPTTGPLSQTICTSGFSCAVGPGTAVQLQPGTAQADTGSGSSIFINNTGGGDLLQLQGAGNDIFVVTNSGNITAAGTATVQGGSLTLGAASVAGSITFHDGSMANTGLLQLAGALAGNVVYNLPTATGTQTICTIESGNCAGSGGGVITSGGTAGYLPVFTASQTIADSIVSQAGSALTVGGNLVVDTASGFVGNLINLAVNGSSKLTVDQAGNSIQAGTLTVSSTSTSSIAGSLTLGTGLTVSSGGATITGNSTVNGTLSVTAANALSLGSASTNTGAIVFRGSGGNGTLTLAGPTTPNVGNYTLSIPAITGNANICTDNSICAGYAPASGSNNYINNGTSPQTADFNITGSGTAGSLSAGTVNATTAFTLNGTNINTAGTLSNVAYLNQTQTFTGSNLFKPSADSTTAFQIQKSDATPLFTVDTTNSRIAIGPSAVAANSVLTVGTNTTAASGGLTFGTDTNLYRSAANTLKTDDSLVVNGSVGVGTNPITGSKLYSINASTATSGTIIAVAGATNASPGSPTTATYYGGQFGVAAQSNQTFGVIIGLEGNGYNFGGGDVTEGYGISGYYQNSTTLGGTTDTGVGVMGEVANQTNGTINDAVALQAKVRNPGASATIHNGYGLRVLTATNGGTATFENNYGVYIQDQSGVGSVSSYNFYSAGATAKNYVEGILQVGSSDATARLNIGSSSDTTAAGGILLGSDTTLYRSAANTLKTDGDLVAGGNVDVQGGGLTVGVAGTTAGSLNLANGSNSNLTVLQAAAPSGSGNATITIPSIAGGSSDEVCLVTLGNCAGSGGGITGSGTAGTLAIFTGSGTIGDSVITQSGSAVSVAGTLAVTGASSLSLGTASTNTGGLTLYNSSNGNTLTLQAGATASNLTFTLPTADGSNGYCLQTNGAGALSFNACTGGAAGGVTSLDGLSGVLTLANSSGSGATITIDDAAADGTTKGIATFNSTNFQAAAGVINTIQDIATTSAPTFAGLTVNGNTLVKTTSTTAFQIQNASAQPLMIADTTNSRVAIGPAAVAANSVLTVGTNTTAASGGITFGTDTNLYRSAANTLKTDDSLQVAGRGAFGAQSSITSSITLRVQETRTDTSGSIINTYGQLDANPGSNSTATYRGGWFIAQSQAGNVRNMSQLMGVQSNASHNGTGTVDAVIGASGNGGNFSTGTVTLGYGVGGFYNNNAGGTTTTAYGVAAGASNNSSGDIGTLAGVRSAISNFGSGDVTTGYGLLVESAINSGGGTFDSNYGIYIQDQSGVGSTNSYNLYSAGTTAKNRLEGQLELGVASSSTGKIVFYNSAGSNTITLQGPAGNPGGNYTLTIPTLTGNDTICVASLNNCTAVGAAGGDLTGTYPNPTIAKLQGTTLTLSSLASGDVLQYNGSAIVNGHITDSNLTAGTFSNITGTGALNAGSITTGFGPISTTSNISTTANVHGDTLTVGTSNQFQVDASGNVTVGNTAAIQGANGLTLGVASSTAGLLSFANATNSNLTVVQADAPSGTGNATITIPSIAGGSSDEVCLVTLGNCAGSGAGVTISSPGTNGTIAMFTGTQTIANSILTQSGTTLTVGGNQIINAASGFTGNLINLEVDGSSKLTVDEQGDITTGGTLTVNGVGTSSIAGALNVAGILTASATGKTALTISDSGAQNSGLTIGGDTNLYRSAANLLQSDDSLTILGTISSPGSGSLSERFGTGSTTGSATNATAIGASASATGNNSTAIGKSSTAGISGVAIGGATAGSNAVAVGSGAVANANNSVALGRSTSVTQASSIGIGTNATTTATNQLVIGGNSNAIQDGYIGNGVTNASPTAFTLHATGGSGTDIAGAALQLAGGIGTGAGNGGDINFQIAKPGSTGSSLNTLATVASFSGVNGAALFQNSADSTTAFQIQNAAGTSNLFVADTTNSKIGIATAPSAGGATLQVGGSISLTTLGTADTTTALCRNSSNQIASCTGTGTGAAFVQGGNSFGGTAILGTNDTNSLAFETDGTTRWLIDTSGHLLPNANDTYDIGSDTARVRDLYLGGETLHIGTSTTDEGTLSYTTSTNLLTLGNQASSSNGGVLIKNAADSATAFQIQNAAGANIMTASTSGNTVVFGSASNVVTLSSPGAGTNSEHFGAGSSTGANSNNLAVGSGASTTGSSSTAIGRLSSSGDFGLAVGASSTANGGTTAIGVQASTGSTTQSIAIGRSSTATANNQLVIGSSNGVIQDGYIGNGVTSATPVGFTLHASGGSGSNIAGAALQLAGGIGTGTGNGGNINFQIAKPGSTGSSLNTLATVASLSGVNGAALFQNAANSTTAFQIQNSAGTSDLFVADTTNTRIGLGVTPITTSGSGLLQVGASGSTTAAQGLSFGGDTSANLYRSAAGVIKTDGALDAASYKVGGVAGASASCSSGQYLNTAVLTNGIITSTSCGNVATQTSLQQAYANSSSPALITTSNAKDLQVTLADTATDSNFLVNVATSSTSKFAVQYNGADTFSISNAASAQGSALFKNAADNTTAFQIQNAAGTSNLFVADTTNTRIGLGIAPATTAGLGLLQVGAASSTTAAQGISFGNDTSANLYRSASATIRTDGSLLVSSALTVGSDITARNGGAGQTKIGAVVSGNAGLLLGSAGDTNLYRNGSAGELKTDGNLTVAGTLTSPGAGASSEHFGASSTTGSATFSLAVGTSATVTGNFGTAIGASASSTGSSLAVGRAATATGSRTTAIGESAQATHNFSIALGEGAVTTASNQFIVGSAGSIIGQAYIGAGVTYTAPTQVTLNATGGSGTDIAGATLNLAGGKGTGAGNGGDVNIQIAKPGTTGTSLNTLASVASFSGVNGAALFKNSADSTTAFQVQNAAGANIMTADTSGNTIIFGSASNVVTLSSPGSGSNSEHFGANSTTNATTNSTAVGRGANTTGNQATAVGSGAGAAVQGIAIGNAANASNKGIAIGFNTSVNANSIGIGTVATTTASNQLVIGGPTGSSAYIQDGYFGSGVTDATPKDFTLHGTGGSGSNIAGASLTLAGGIGTGTGNGGNVNIQVAKPGSTGSSLNSLATVASFSGVNGAALFQNAADSTTAFQIKTSGGSQLFVADTTDGTISIGSSAPTSQKLYIYAGTKDGIMVDQDNASTASLLRLQHNGSDVFKVGSSGDTLIKDTSATAFQVQDASANVTAVFSSQNYAGGANAANAVLKLAKDSGTNRSINAAGSVNASGADYAEYIPWEGELPEPGSIVQYNGSSYVVSSRLTAAFVGNDRFESTGSILVTFAGQVPVKVTGTVNIGDILVDNGDGTARAVNPATASLMDFFGKLGIAQEASSENGVKPVLAAVGTTSSNAATALQQSNGIFADLNVSGSSTTQNLTVTGTATITTLRVTGSAEFAGDITVGGHIITAGGQPTATAQASAGGSASVSVDGTDTTGTITITTGSAPSAGELAKILFSKTYGKAPHIVLSASNDNAAGLKYYKGATSATNFMLNAQEAPQANTVYKFDYFIAQ